jgi:hypothetical protein
MSDQVQFEVKDPAPKAEPAEVKTQTKDELVSLGWSAKEIESAQKRGMIATPDEKKETVEPEKKEVSEEPAKKPEDKPKSTLPDFTFKTPEQEKVFLEAFGTGTPQRAMYFRMKNERQARQAIEKERDAARQEAEAFKVRIEALEAVVGKNNDVDENGNVIDPEDKPLTLKQLRELQKAEAEALKKSSDEQSEQQTRVVEAQRTQEEYARSVFEDFDDTVTKAKEVMQNLETLVPEKWKQAKAVKLIRDLQYAAHHADKIDLDDYHAAYIAYEIGKLHPDFSQVNGRESDQDGKSSDPKKANGGQLTPEQMKRLEENTQRRGSSASLPGGNGRRVVSGENVDAKTLNQMSYADRQRFREKYPERYAQILRG